MDLRKLNSATKYPSIATYHDLDPSNGHLIESGNPFAGHDGEVFVTEKVDGTNARLIKYEDDWFIGSREELLTARGDRIPNTQLGIVDAVLPYADREEWAPGEVLVYYFEVYGARKLPAWPKYGDGSTAAVRCFDFARIPAEVLDWPIEKIAAWRDGGGQRYFSARDLTISVPWPGGFNLVPTLTVFPAAELPATVQGMRDFMGELAPQTRAAIDPAAARPGPPEGLVLRTLDRGIIRKARFEDYDRTLNPRLPMGNKLARPKGAKP